MSTTDRQVSRLVAFFHTDKRLIFSDFKSASIVRSQVWLGLPFGRFHSEAFELLMHDNKFDNSKTNYSKVLKLGVLQVI